MTTEPTDLTGSPSPDAQEKNVTWKGLAHLMVVYVVWGSTYLGIRIAVREGAGFPPFIMGAMRTLVSGGLLLLLAVLLKGASNSLKAKSSSWGSPDCCYGWAGTAWWYGQNSAPIPFLLL